MHLLSSRRWLVHTIQTHRNTNVRLDRQPQRRNRLCLRHACCGKVGHGWPASRSSNMFSIQDRGWSAKDTRSVRGITYTKQVPYHWCVPTTDAAGQGQ